MPPDTASPRPGQRQPRARRADAQRNRELLLAAAAQIFAERGPEAHLDDIARRAGIGNATMYRHFPTRRELIIAVFADEVAALCAEGEALLRDEPPADALFSWLRAFVAHVATKRELATSIPNDGGGQRSALFDQWHDAMRATASALLTRAQSAGEVSPSVSAADLLVLANGIAVASTSADQASRCLDILRHGSTPDRGHPRSS